MPVLLGQDFIVDPAVVNALKEAGIAIAAIVVMAVLFVVIVRFLANFLLSTGKSDDKKWDDFMQIRNDDRETDRQILAHIQSLIEELQDSRAVNDERQKDSMTEMKRRFDALEEGIRHLHDDIEAIRDAVSDIHANG